MLYGWFGENNLGDELLLRSAIQMLQTYGNHLEACVMGSRPAVVRRNHTGIKRVSASFYGSLRSLLQLIWHNPISAITNLARCRCLIVVGGGALSDWHRSSTRKLFFTINLFSRMKRPIYLMGVGAGPIKNPESQQEFCRVLSKASLITTRDKPSAGLLSSIGIDSVHPSNDLVFYSGISAEQPEACHKVKKIGLVLAPVCMSSPAVYQSLVTEAGRLIRSLSEKYEVSLIPFQYEYDRGFLEQLDYDRSRVPILYDADNIWKTVDYCREQDLIVGMRFHSLVLALLLHKYLIPIVYHPKSAALCEEFGLGKYTSYIGDGDNWPVSNISAEHIQHSIEQIQKDPEIVALCSETLQRKINRNIEKEIIARL